MCTFKNLYTHTNTHTQERSLERLTPLSPTITCRFVCLCECLLGSPPDQACLRYVSDHLLVSDLNEVKFVTPPGPMDTSISAFDGTRRTLTISLDLSTDKAS